CGGEADPAQRQPPAASGPGSSRYGSDRAPWPVCLRHGTARGRKSLVAAKVAPPARVTRGNDAEPRQAATMPKPGSMEGEMTMKRAAVLALALAAGSAHADGANLRAALSVLPDTVFSAASPDVARYLDLSALAARHGGVLGPEALTRATLGGGIRPIEAMALATPQDFAAKAGIDSAALSFVAGLGRLPAAVSIWGFADDDAAAAAYSGLSAQGFSRLGLLPGMLANGEPN